LKVQIPDDTDVIVVNQGIGGISSNAFRNLALSYVDENGQVLPRFLASKGLLLDGYDKIVLAGFSAFHGFANEVLKREANRITGLISLDACFSAKSHLPKEGYVLLSRRAIQGHAVVVLTASLGGGQTFSTGQECVIATAAEAMELEGVEPSPVSVQGIPAPERSFMSGDLYVLDYGGKFSHGQHVSTLAEPILTRFLLPILEGDLPSVSVVSENSRSGSNAGVALVGLAAFFSMVGAGWILSRRKG